MGCRTKDQPTAAGLDHRGTSAWISPRDRQRTPDRPRGRIRIWLAISRCWSRLGMWGISEDHRRFLANNRAQVRQAPRLRSAQEATWVRELPWAQRSRWAQRSPWAQETATARLTAWPMQWEWDSVGRALATQRHSLAENLVRLPSFQNRTTPATRPPREQRFDRAIDNSQSEASPNATLCCVSL